MSTPFREKKVKIRKPHRCFGCARMFEPGTIMTKQEFADDGSVESSYLCNTCFGITQKMDWWDEYGYSELRDEALEIEGMDLNENASCN